ncbi:hypothetical protein BC830DRAFT_92125 [Chytriomyces sp. MP71]|nr:hypothetical protein BC830DRAFT_92125 [Chytriomyces sp. MP71]
MFARLSLKEAHPRAPARDPAAQARLLSGTAAWKAKLASAAEEASMNAALHRIVRKAEVELEPGLGVGLTKLSNPVWAVAPRGPTVPKEFNFALGRKDRVMRPKSPGIKVLHDSKLIRVLNHLNLNQKRKPVMKKQPELTVPKPFKLHETSHSRPHQISAEQREMDGSPFVALAVKVKKFETDTPERFRPVVKAVAAAQASGVSRLTKPHSPLLLTKVRVKQQNVKTSEEQLLEEIKSHPPFKAQLVNKKVLTQPSLGVPPPQKHTPTIPQSPNFSKPRIPPPPPPKPPTPPKVIKAHPLPRPLKPFEPVVNHRFIVPAEVKLPGEEMRTRKLREFEEERRRIEEDEERVRRFVARPVPDLEAVDPLPYVPSKPPTQPDPFHLHTASARGGSAFAKSGAELSAGELLAAASKFTAQPVPCADHPFIPHRSAKPPTIPDPILLHTDVRVEERARFEEARRERERVEEEARERARLEREELEREEVRRLRAAQVFLAQPVKQFPGLTVHASQRRLTEPESPMLKEKRERMARLRSDAGRHAPVRFEFVAVAAEGKGGDNVDEEEQDEGQLEEEQEEFAAEGQFEDSGEEQFGDDSVLHEAGRKEWPALQEWVDSDGVSGSEIF